MSAKQPNNYPTQSKPKAPPSPPSKSELHANPCLYRAKLNCKIARDALDGTCRPIEINDVTRTEYALYCLCHAVEEIAQHMMNESKETKTC